MLPVLQNLLCNEYPTLYQDRQNAEKMVFECNDGWFALIDTLSSLIVKRSRTTVVEQVKEGDYGSLLVCVSGYAPEDYDYIFGITRLAYYLSQLICEKCGSRGTFINSCGMTARCELHDPWSSHQLEYDETLNLPFPMRMKGTMWRLMILEFYQLIQIHTKSNDMPAVDIHYVKKFKGKLCIKLAGGNEITQGMLALLLAYAEKIDEETGEILNR
ncbi:hypothetical protein [Methylobacter sp. BlB1]|uniref:hypothetical protein n=1 Tax=Methylobacter sp. BlB1 TaxID=2785914 RepID=UPI0018956B80|nr:hypothetical protein [Methylobacter sp. BlB1]MBF6650423.1 hypothetical protein [Methylobacter sp. BlB1]